jgi:hypothetical protein
MQGFKEWLIQEESRIICETAEMSSLEKQQYRDARAIFRKYVFEVPGLSIGKKGYLTYKDSNLFMGTPDKFIIDLENYKIPYKNLLTNHYKNEYKRLTALNLALIPEDEPNREELKAYAQEQSRIGAIQAGINKLRELDSLIDYFRKLKPEEPKNPKEPEEIVKFDFSDATGSFL